MKNLDAIRELETPILLYDSTINTIVGQGNQVCKIRVEKWGKNGN